MKKFLKRVFAGLGVLVALAVLGMVVKFYVLSPKMRVAPDVKAPTTAEAIARGKYLANHVTACLGCHSETDLEKSGEPVLPGMLGSGRNFPDLPGFPGHVHAHNLTPDKETGIGAWTDGEVLRAIREGVGKDGHALFPMMPYQTYAAVLSDEDALSIIAYLRTLDPVKNDPGKMEVNFPVSMFIRAVPTPLAQAAPAAPTEQKARGEWLLKVCSCGDCHDSMNERHEAIPGMRLAGGGKFPFPKGTVYAANLTSDKATGIGSYSDDDLRRVLSEGVGKSGRPLYIMPWLYYSGMTKEDKEALLVALRAVPAVTNIVPASVIK